MKKHRVLGFAAVVAILVTIAAVYFVNRERGPAPGKDRERVVVPQQPAGANEALALQQPAPTSFADAWQVLYTGDKPQQSGVKTGAIDSRRAAVLHGRVLTPGGEPIPDVMLTIEHHPEFGGTRSGQDGSFAMAVNGGGQLRIHYHKQGLLPLCRQVSVPWRDHAWLPDVSLLPVDGAVTAIDLAGKAAFQVAQSNPVRDKDGERRATLLVPQGTAAELILPDGKKEALSSIHVRMTEYTVGSRGPAAMPASLPANSAYTYAVELTADEVVARGIKVNGKDLLLSKPAIFYVENFLNLAAGVPVPLGYFDNTKGAWTGADCGWVVKVLAIKDGLAELDVEGGDKPADANALKRLQITEEERRQLATLYKPGQGFWRVAVPHFSTWDLNFGFSPPKDATPPGDDGDGNGDGTDNNPDTDCGSLIEIQNQALGENVTLVGTPFRLNYRSNRVPGRVAARSLNIRLSGETIPKSLNRIELEVLVAGQRFIKDDLPAKPNQLYAFTWDGKDSQGRPAAAQQQATIRIGYVYDGVYQRNERFGESGSGVRVTGSRTRQEVTLWSESHRTLGTWDARAGGLGGWTLDVQHAYDPVGRTLFLGDGRQISSGGSGRQGVNQTITTVAGGGEKRDVGDGGPATKARLDNPSWRAGYGMFIGNTYLNYWPSQPWGVAVAPDGDLYISDGMMRIRRVDRSGVITTFAGGGTNEVGDGQPAVQAKLGYPRGLCFGPDGSLYIADRGHHRIRRVGSDGVITTVAGTEKGFGGDGGPATQAKLNEPMAVAVAPDGAFYIADTANHCVRRVGPDGVINTVAGKPVRGPDDKENWPGYGGDGGPAAQARLNWPNYVALGSDGSLFISDSDNDIIRRVSLDGLITTVAGTPPQEGKAARKPYELNSNFSGDGGPATKAKLRGPTALAVGPDGALYIADTSNNCVRRVSPAGLITTVVNQGRPGNLDFGLGGRFPGGDDGSATKALLTAPCGLAFGPDGALFLFDGCNTVSFGEPPYLRIRKVLPALPGFADNEFAVPSQDGSELYKFDQTGRHLETLDTLNGKARYRFSYDAQGRLSKVEDAFGNVTTIERDSGGRPQAVAGPFGARTTLQLDPESGYLVSVTNPAGEAVSFTYHGKLGLLAAFKDARGNTSRFTYDDMGRLVKDEDAAGGFTALTRQVTDHGFEIGQTKAERNLATTFLTERLRSGDQIKLNKCCCGAETKTQAAADGSEKVVYPDGSVYTRTEQPDPRWGLLAPLTKTFSLATPSGRALNVSLDRKVVLEKTESPLSPKSITDTITVNGRAYTRTFDAAKKQVIRKTPGGRETVTTLDEYNRPIKVEVSGLLPVSYSYDNQGRLTTIQQGEGAVAQVVGIEFNADNRVASITDALKRRTRLEYDNAGRVIEWMLPDGRKIVDGYDAAGNVTSVTPPGRPPHHFDFTPVGLAGRYCPPMTGKDEEAVAFLYDADKNLAQVQYPDGQVVKFTHGNGERLEVVTFPGGKLIVTYDPQTALLASISTADGTGVSYAYDGFLPIETKWEGPVHGTVGETYDNDFRVVSTTVNGGHRIDYKYDDDGLLVQAGELMLLRDAKSGLIQGTRLGNVTTSQSYDGFGDPTEFQAAFQDKNLLEVHCDRDSLGRITKKTETIEGQTTVVEYAYDLAGRLSDVRQGGKPLAHYEYDTNGNRVKQVHADGTEVTAAYDDQDRLLACGKTTYRYHASGQLSAKTEEGGTFTYRYDPLNNLRVATPAGNSSRIEYLVDGFGRRIGKKVGGSLIQAFLYRDQLQPLAELDGENKVRSLFVYGEDGAAADYMTKGGNVYRILSDQLGSPRLVVDTATGKVAQRLDYDAFGNLLADSNPSFQPFGFGGGIFDPQTALTHFGARDFDAGSGRWTSKDPILFAAGDTNLFQFGGGDPVNTRDPTGLQEGVSPVDVIGPTTTTVVGNSSGGVTVIVRPSGPGGNGQGSSLPFGLNTPGSLSDKLIPDSPLGFQPFGKGFFWTPAGISTSPLLTGPDRSLTFPGAFMKDPRSGEDVPQNPTTQPCSSAVGVKINIPFGGPKKNHKK